MIPLMIVDLPAVAGGRRLPAARRFVREIRRLPARSLL
jgi:hypothetical protein